MLMKIKMFLYYIMSFFRKAFRSVGHVFSKGASEVAGVFRKGGNTIARGLGGLTGSALGAGIGGAIGSLAGPEGSLAGAAVGRIIGGVAGGEGASRIEEATRRRKGKPTEGQVVTAVQSVHERAGSQPITTKPYTPRRLGEGGAGQKRMMTDKDKENELEKLRVQRKEKRQFV
jgi:uncharacterized protein YcfJ